MRKILCLQSYKKGPTFLCPVVENIRLGNLQIHGWPQSPTAVKLTVDNSA